MSGILCSTLTLGNPQFRDARESNLYGVYGALGRGSSYVRSFTPTQYRRFPWRRNDVCVGSSARTPHNTRGESFRIRGSFPQLLQCWPHSFATSLQSNPTRKYQAVLITGTCPSSEFFSFYSLAGCLYVRRRTIRSREVGPFRFDFSRTAHQYVKEPVSYTHLTLPTNREV